MYRFLVHNKCRIPELGLKIIRYHSFYVWHRENQYSYLESESDTEVKKWCRIFSDCDLYTKNDTDNFDIDLIKSYYEDLVKKYFDNEILEW